MNWQKWRTEDKRRSDFWQCRANNFAWLQKCIRVLEDWVVSKEKGRTLNWRAVVGKVQGSKWAPARASCTTVRTARAAYFCLHFFTLWLPRRSFGAALLGSSITNVWIFWHLRSIKLEYFHETYRKVNMSRESTEGLLWLLRQENAWILLSNCKFYWENLRCQHQVKEVSY